MNFKYYAIDSAGKPQNGLIEADGEPSARNEIKGKGLYLVSLKETVNQGKSGREYFFFWNRTETTRTARPATPPLS